MLIFAKPQHTSHIYAMFDTIKNSERHKYLFNGEHSVVYDEPTGLKEGRVTFLSLSKDKEIIGFFSAFINPSSGIADDLVVVNFSDKPSYTFSKDFIKFIQWLIDNNRMAIFACPLNNEEVFGLDAKIVKKFKGRKVGVIKGYYRYGEKNLDSDMIIFQIEKSKIPKNRLVKK